MVFPKLAIMKKRKTDLIFSNRLGTWDKKLIRFRDMHLVLRHQRISANEPKNRGAGLAEKDLKYKRPTTPWGRARCILST